jgi:dihydrofolate synthase/folylpolyglutamate synthase
LTPRAALAYLEERAHLGVKFGLETTRALLAALGHPERAAPCLLVAGTNGKGSVCAMLEAALRAGGLRTGLYTSPHLVRPNERIAVAGRAVSDRDLARAVSAVRDAAARLVREGRLPAHPTYFEAMTAAAFVHFRTARVDVSVLEVGLGGRLDATNAADPLVSAVVSIDFDHQEFLGDSLAAIAREKAGVMRARRTVVVGPAPDEVLRTLRAEARRKGARFALVAPTSGAATPALPGAHQAVNLAVAGRVLEEAHAAGLPFDLERARPGLRRVRWPGRLQRIPGRPPLLLDGAHNPAGARALAAYLRGQGPLVLVFGAMADKDLRTLARELFPLARLVVLTRPDLERAAHPRAIAAAAGPRLARRCRLEPDVGRALARARRLARPGETVVVAGSLYLVGAVLARRRSRKWSRASGRSHSATPR